MSAETPAVQRTRREELLHRFEDLTEWPLLLLALAMIPLLVVPLVADVSDATNTAIETSLWIIWAVFLVELSVRTYLAERRVEYLARHWYDVLIVAVPFLRPLRIIRSARAIRLVRLVRVAPVAVRAWASAHAILRHRGLQYVLLFGVIVILASAGVVMLFERDQGPIDDYGTALWWAITTMTTVGYGDVVPVTPEGKGVAVVLMLVGIAFFSWVTANVAAFLVEFGGGDDEEHRGVTTNDLMLKLESLENEIRQLRAERDHDAGGS